MKIKLTSVYVDNQDKALHFCMAKAYQQAMFQQGQPAAMFYTDDVRGDYERIKARGAEFTMPPSQVTGSTIAMLNDTCGNLIHIGQLARG